MKEKGKSLLPITERLMCSQWSFMGFPGTNLSVDIIQAFRICECEGQLLNQRALQEPGKNPEYSNNFGVEKTCLNWNES